MVEANGEAGVYALSGELDVVGVPVLYSVPVTPGADETVVLDLSGLTFLERAASAR